MIKVRMPICTCMKRLILIVSAWLVPIGLAHAENSLPVPTTVSISARAADAYSLHGVWYSSRVYLPFYSDLELAAYLSSLPGPADDLAVLPVYSAQPIHFRRGRYVFVSTGLILQARDERELLGTIHREIPSAGTTGSDFHEVQSRLAAQIAQYIEISRPRLRRRP